MKKISWETMAKECEKEYGMFVDWEEKFYICPECDEPIYMVDYPFIEVNEYAEDKEPFTMADCPVCREMIEIF